MEIIKDDNRLREICDAGKGYIYNDFEGNHHTSSSKESNKLHRASCDQCDPRRDRNAMTTKTSGQKIFFDDYRNMYDWLIGNRPGNYSKCAFCNP